jgi:transitional endoplasmic reticulum ATPase
LVKVRVIPAPTKDFGKRIVRVEKSLLEKYSIVENEVIEIIGDKKRSAAFIKSFKKEPELNSKLLQEDEYESLISLDGLIRASVGCSIDSIIRIDKTAVKQAKKIVFAPLIRDIVSTPIDLKIINHYPLFEFDIVTLNSLSSANLTFSEPDLERAEVQTHGNLGEIRYVVVETDPKGVVQINGDTKIEFENELPESIKKQSLSGALTYDDIGGYNLAKIRIHQLIEIPLKNPQLFMQLNVEFPRGVLISGLSGIGKSLLANAVANESNAYIVRIDPAEIISSDVKESQKALTKCFKEAEIKAPSLIIIDNIQEIAPIRNVNTIGEVTRRLTSQLITEIDQIPADLPVQILALTDSSDKIDSALKRPGRFDSEITMNPPDRNERLEILEIKTRGVPLHHSVNLDDIANRTKTYIGADLASLVKEAALSAFSRLIPSVNIRKEIPSHILNSLNINVNDFQTAIRRIQPSAMKSIIADIPEVTWDDVGGLKSVKQSLIEAVEWPLKYPSIFKEMGIDPPTGVLLYGPPGTGKTLLAQAIATISKGNFIPVRGPELLSKWLGESEEKVREIFKLARELSPSIIFFDEIDSLIRIRGASPNESYMDRIINQFLTEMQGIDKKSQILIIGATNRPELLDPAIMRPGRFDRLLYIPPPNYEERMAILKVHTKNMPIAEDVDLSEIAKQTEYFTGADLQNLCREAALLSLRENFDDRNIRAIHFNNALKTTAPTMSKQLQEHFDNLSQNLRGKATANQAKNFEDLFS